FGVTVNGPFHRQNKDTNQDAWLGRCRAEHTFITVADGLGSKTHSAIGAKMACLAVSDATRIWSDSNSSLSDIFRLIKILWEIKIAPHSPRDCATTCLFALVRYGKDVIIAGLGDGLGVIRHPNGNMNYVISRETEFSNLTTGLGLDHKIEDWNVRRFNELPFGSAIMLATDGIADDLLPERVPDFIKFLIDEFGHKPPKDRYFALRKILFDWPTPNHQDDKTLAIMHSISE
ncbi:PP2C family serine/threonine-protein phosphatase, partial [Chloroflexota bacterium]